MQIDLQLEKLFSARYSGLHFVKRSIHVGDLRGGFMFVNSISGYRFVNLRMNM